MELGRIHLVGYRHVLEVRFDFSRMSRSQEDHHTWVAQDSALRQMGEPCLLRGKITESNQPAPVVVGMSVLLCSFGWPIPCYFFHHRDPSPSLFRIALPSWLFGGKVNDELEVEGVVGQLPGPGMMGYIR